MVENKQQDITESMASLVSDILDTQKRIQAENDALHLENESLRATVSDFLLIKHENEELLEKLEDAKKTKRTLKKIELLEYTIESLIKEAKVREAHLASLKSSSSINDKLVKDSRIIHSRLLSLAEKVGVKTGNRSTESLLKAVEDSIRKLV